MGRRLKNVDQSTKKYTIKEDNITQFLILQCPFHGDDEYKFLIYWPWQRRFYCFKCEESGSAIKFIDKLAEIDVIKESKMPLKKGKGKKILKENIKEMVKSGHPVKQSAAAAYSEQKKSKSKSKK